MVKNQKKKSDTTQKVLMLRLCMEIPQNNAHQFPATGKNVTSVTKKNYLLQSAQPLLAIEEIR